MRATLFSATLGEDRKVEPPLGPLYIAAVLEGLGWEIDFRDYQLFQGADAFSPATMIQCLTGHESVLLISCFVDMLPVVIAATLQIKQNRPETYIILGGPGPTGNARAILERFQHLNAIVLGEGEETIRDWAIKFKGVQLQNGPRDPIDGMVCRQNGLLIEGQPRARILDPSTLPFPSYHLLDWSRYSAARVITTRGCPYHCSFCDVAPLWGRKAVYRDLSDTIDEMLKLRDIYGKHEIAVVDDTFVLNRERVRRFCHLLIDRKADLKWGCFGRINLMSESLIALMTEAGCRAIFYGIDSGAPRVLDRTFKELDPNSVLPIIRTSAEYFDTVEASFIWGYPFETYADFLLTLELAAKASLYAPQVNVQLHMLSPLPSSPLLREFTGQLIAPEDEDRDWLLLPGLLLDPRAGSVREIVDSAPELFPGFFAFPTPDKAAKRDRLSEIRSAMYQVVGRVVTDSRVRGLLHVDDPALEGLILNQAKSVTDQIGAGLALSLFRRARRRFCEGDRTSTLECHRTASMVRVRNDTLFG